jgi:hypothetical protein
MLGDELSPDSRAFATDRVDGADENKSDLGTHVGTWFLENCPLLYVC